MGDGNELDGEAPDDYTYDDWGVYDIDLFITNGSCSSEATSSIEITPPAPIADFMLDTVGCAPMTVHFESNSQFALSYHWDFGDGGEAQVENPVYGYNFPGTYNVTLTVQGYGAGQEDSYTIESAVEVLPSAIAIFTVSPNEVFVPGQPVLGINLSQNATGYEWEFGDGGESNEENPTHFYQTEGWFNVTLVALNDWNCPDTLTIVDAVHAIALGKLEFPNAFTPNSAGPNGGVYDPMAFDNDIFFPLNYGVLEFQMQVFNKWGELLFESNEINIGWDGYYRDKLCKEDVYAWKARARFSDGQEIQKAGDVTLLVK
jgi:PKD repeat protein